MLTDPTPEIDTLQNEPGTTVAMLIVTIPDPMPDNIFAGIDFLTNEAGTRTIITLPDSGTRAYSAFMQMLGAAKQYFLEHGNREMMQFTDVMILNV